MKNNIFFLAIIVIAMCACSNKKKQSTEDPTRIVVPSNSDATNPSLADTAYHEYDSASKKKDSAKKAK